MAGVSAVFSAFWQIPPAIPTLVPSLILLYPLDKAPFTPSPCRWTLYGLGGALPLSTHRPAERRDRGRIHPAAVSPHVFAAGA